MLTLPLHPHHGSTQAIQETERPVPLTVTNLAHTTGEFKTADCTDIQPAVRLSKRLQGLPPSVSPFLTPERPVSAVTVSLLIVGCDADDSLSLTLCPVMMTLCCQRLQSQAALSQSGGQGGCRTCQHQCHLCLQWHCHHPEWSADL